MRKMTIVLFALGLAGTLAAAHGAGAQGGTAPQSQSMGASRSGSAIDSDSGKGEMPTEATQHQFDKGFTGQESGIGEKGSGQDRSTKERSGKPDAQSSDRPQGKDTQPKEK
jgi:hypothetical protein